MIIEHIKNKEKNSRERSCHVLYYLVDTDKNGLILNKKREEIEFIGTSKSIITADPFTPLKHNSSDKQTHLNLDDIKSAFTDIENKNKRVKQPLKHIVISLREGETLSKSEWNKLVSEYVNALGYSDNHWLAVLHKTKNHHVHIMLSCIENSAPYRKTKDGNDFALSAKIRDSLEDKFNLKKDNNPYVSGLNGNRVNNSHYKNKVQALRSCIDDVISKNRNSTKLPYFLDKLSEAGIGCFVKLNGFEIEGISFSMGVTNFKGSSLGIGYSWAELKKRGLVYTHQRELDDILYSNQRESAVNHLVKNAYEKEDIHDDRTKLDQHYLIEASDTVTEFPDDKSSQSYSVFRLLTPIKSAQKKLLTTAKQKLKQLQELRKSLYSLYNFLYRYSTQKIDAIIRYPQISGANLQFLFEQAPNKSPINKLVEDNSNLNCLNTTGLLLISAKNFNLRSPSTKEFKLNFNDKASVKPSATITTDNHNNIRNYKENGSESTQEDIKHRSKRSDNDFDFLL